MPISKNNEVWISCGGKRLSEYGLKADGVKVSCSIISEIGKELHIYWRARRGPISIPIVLTFSIDGDMINKMVMEPGSTSCVMLGARIGPNKVKPLVFSSNRHMAADCKQLMGTTPVGPGLGKITVEIFQRRIIKRPSGKAPRTYSISDKSWKKKKGPGAKTPPAHSHIISLSSETIEISDSSIPRHHTTIPYDKEHTGPIATFIFNYGPEESLRAQGAFPPSLTHSQDKPRSSDYMADPESTSSQASKSPTNRASGSKKRTSYFNSKGKHRAVSEESYDEDELFRRLVKQLAENQSEQDKIMDSTSLKGFAVSLKSLQFWQARMRETQEHIATTLDEMNSLREPVRKKARNDSMKGTMSEEHSEIVD